MTGRGEPNSDDVDAAWARIVADFDTEVTGADRPWPDAEDTPKKINLAKPEAEPRAEPGRTAERPVGPRDPDPDEPTLLDRLNVELPEDPESEESYTPPPPPPMPRFSGQTIGAVLGIAVGVVLLFWPTLLSPIGPTTVMLLAFGAIIAGFVALVWRLRAGDEEDDPPPDDGAVV